MKDSGNDYQPLSFDQFVNNAVGKSFRIASTNILYVIPAAVQQRIDVEGIKYAQDLFDKLISEPFAFRVIPF